MDGGEAAKREKFELVEHERLPDPVRLACRLWCALKRCGPIPSKDRPAWTAAVAHAVARLCPEGLKVYGKQWNHEEQGEYLVDQCWRQYHANKAGTHYFPGAIVFAMECEWLGNPRAQLHDFRKLLDVRADMCLFVAGLSKWAKAHEAVVECTLMVDHHSRFRGELILYFFDRNDPAFNFQAWCIRRTADETRKLPYNLGAFIEGGGCEEFPECH